MQTPKFMQKLRLDTTSKTQVPNLQRNFHIDLVKFVALFLVIAHHANAELGIINTLTAVNYPEWLTLNAYNAIVMLAVPLFVMASGGVLLDKTKSSEPLKVFIKKRITRLLLPFIFWAIIYCIYRVYVNHDTIPLTFPSLISNLNDPYYQFWFIYMIVGLYLLTPLLRVVVANAPKNVLRYGLLLWFFTFTVLPLLNQYMSVTLVNKYLLDTSTLATFVGFFVLGAVLPKEPIKHYQLYFLGVVATVSLSAASSWLLTLNNNGTATGLPTDTSLFNLLGSVFLFLFLGGIAQTIKKFVGSVGQAFIRKVGELSLGIYLIHVLILECFEKGIFGVKISMSLLNPIFEVPLMAVAVFSVSFALVFIGSKVPILQRLVN